MSLPPQIIPPPAPLPPGVDTVAPSAVHASPCQVSTPTDRDAPFWTPGWGYALKHLGWRWILFFPPIIVIGSWIAALFLPRFGMRIWWIGIKPSIILLALPFTAAKKLMHASVKRRDEPFCIHCGYGLSGLPDNYQCPECGRPYTHAVIEEYRTDPAFFVQRWKSQHKSPIADVPFAAGTVRKRRSRDGT
jgi:hypothetical protein